MFPQLRAYRSSDRILAPLQDSEKFMVKLSQHHVHMVSGGVPIGVAAAALAVGFVTGGPPGLGIAIGGLIINKGSSKLYHLVSTGEIT